MKPFQDYIDKTVDFNVVEVLPLIHNTDALSFTSILTEGLIPHPCKVGNDTRNITCFFYGRPVYIPKERLKPRPDSFFVPVCLVVKPGIIDLSAVYPTDTGAYTLNERMGEIFQGLDVELYRMEAEIDNIRAYIVNFFGSNKNYYHGKCDLSPQATAIDDIVRELFVEMLCDLDERLDGRNRAIEVHTENRYDLKNIVEFIIVPEYLLDKAVSLGSSIEVRTYNDYGGKNQPQKSLVDKIEQMVEEYLTEKYLI